MTLEQKAMLFCKCSNRKDRKYKIIHEYKDCIIGKQGVDFLINNKICKNRKAAIRLAQDFIDKGYMFHVGDKYEFKDDKNFWYKFDDEAIQYANNHLMRYSDDEKDEETSDDESIIICDPSQMFLDVPTNSKYPQSKSQSSDSMELNNSIIATLESITNHHVATTENDIKSSGVLSSDEDEEEEEEDDGEDFIKNISILKFDNTKKMKRLGINHKKAIKWLLSLYTLDELQAMMPSGLKQLIKAPKMNGLVISRSYDDYNEYGFECTVQSENELDELEENEEDDDKFPFPTLRLTAKASESDNNELFMGYHGRMNYKMSNKYKLNVKPFTMNNITNEERRKLLAVQQMKFETYLDALKFVFCELWEIYNEYCCKMYLKMIGSLALVEKMKLMAICVERKNRLKNLYKYKNCFVGAEAVKFMINAKLAVSRAGGLYLGNMFYKKKWLKHVKNEHVFEDKQDLFYVVIEDELENRLDELKMYREQQASNHVNISLDIVTSPKSPIRIADKSGSIVRFFIDGDKGEDSDEILYDYHDSTKSTLSNTPLIPHYSSKSVSFHVSSQKKNKSTSLEDVETYFDQ